MRKKKTKENKLAGEKDKEHRKKKKRELDWQERKWRRTLGTSQKRKASRIRGGQ
jgi:ribosomal protein S8E